MQPTGRGNTSRSAEEKVLLDNLLGACLPAAHRDLASEMDVTWVQAHKHGGKQRGYMYGFSLCRCNPLDPWARWSWLVVVVPHSWSRMRIRGQELEDLSEDWPALVPVPEAESLSLFCGDSGSLIFWPTSRRRKMGRLAAWV